MADEKEKILELEKKISELEEKIFKLEKNLNILQIGLTLKIYRAKFGKILKDMKDFIKSATKDV